MTSPRFPHAEGPLVEPEGVNAGSAAGTVEGGDPPLPPASPRRIWTPTAPGPPDPEDVGPFEDPDAERESGQDDGLLS